MYHIKLDHPCISDLSTFCIPCFNLADIIRYPFGQIRNWVILDAFLLSLQSFTMPSASFPNLLLSFCPPGHYLGLGIHHFYHDWQKNLLIWLATERSETIADVLLPCWKPSLGSPVCCAPCFLSRPIFHGALCTCCPPSSCCSLPWRFPTSSLDSLLPPILSFDSSGKPPLPPPFPPGLF